MPIDSADANRIEFSRGDGDGVNVGSLRIDPPLLLAPMAGFTDAPMRWMCRRHGAALTFTEMVDANGLVHGSRKTIRLLDTLPDEAPVAAHLFGSDPGVLADAAAWVEQTGRFAVIDLNAGCPARKILRKGAGAALMRDPEKLGRIVAAMRAATRLPLMVKTRIGLHPRETTIASLAARIEDAGADALSVHARPVSRGHQGPVNLDALAEVRRQRGIPVFGNGGVGSAATVREMRSVTGVHGVMIGRAAIGAPWVFAEAVYGGWPQRSWFPPDLAQRRAMLYEHVDWLVRFCEQQHALLPAAAAWRHDPGEDAAIRFRPHLVRYLHGLRGARAVRSRLNAIRDLDTLRRAVDACFECERLRDASG